MNGRKRVATRQFYQLGVEAFGMDGIAIEAEVILLSVRLWQALDLSDYLTLEINNLGTTEDRQSYCDALRGYLQGL